jgi:hypothetical protein
MICLTHIRGDEIFRNHGTDLSRAAVRDQLLQGEPIQRNATRACIRVDRAEVEAPAVRVVADRVKYPFSDLRS